VTKDGTPGSARTANAATFSPNSRPVIGTSGHEQVEFAGWGSGVLEVGERTIEEVPLLQFVQFSRARGRRRRLDPANVAQCQVAVEDASQTALDEGPATHVLGLLLQPHDVGRVLVAGHGRGHLLLGPWVQ